MAKLVRYATFSYVIFLLSLLSCCAESTSSFELKQGQELKAWNDSNELVSQNGVFRLAFFKPGSSTNVYLRIWYNMLPNSLEAVWIANPRDPIADGSSAAFSLDFNGRLKITRGGGTSIVLNSNTPVSGNVTASLLDSGNFVLRQVIANGTTLGKVLWQSFDYPTNTLLPGMKVGMSLKSAKNWTIASWLSDQVPSPGAFRLGLDPSGKSQLILWQREDVYWTSGVWKNGSFENLPDLTRKADLFEFKFVSNDDENYFSYSVRNSSVLSRWEVNLWGQILQSDLAVNSSTWENTAVVSLCKPDERYRPHIPCIKQKPNKCVTKSSEGFVPRRGFVNSTRFLSFDFNHELSLSDCQATCWKNCSCVACVTLHSNGTGCMFATSTSDFIPDDSVGYGYFLPSRYSIEAATPNEDGTKRVSVGDMKQRWWIWFVIASVLFVIILLLGYLLYRRRKLRLSQHTGKALLQLRSPVALADGDILRRAGKGKDCELFSFAQVAAATNYFSLENKLGKGGFGHVYKGTLPDGQQIAIKRLMCSSGQGLEEFMNEITLIAELQHTNLVRLFGCCIQGEEKMLVYEYMPNKSLDYFLFDPSKRRLLDWEKRVNIIEGIAQGILYLHKYSRLRIIHRDLKASNILLDQDMNPKISDFGMARIFGRNESKANTMRIVGTYGYMPPEYAMNGIFSIKSDVYSFGVLLLEIVSGKKNNLFYSSSASMSLIELAWDFWKKGDTKEFVDESMRTSCPEDELLRCIHVGLLCVQERADDRPTMLDVIAMLSNNAVHLPDARQPWWCARGGEDGSSSGLDGVSDVTSVNSVTVTVMVPR